MIEPAEKKQGDVPRVVGPEEPLAELIRRRAYELYLERGNRDGSALEDWIQAEREACGR